MTIPATTRVSPIYSGNASATTFAFGYKTYAKQELQVVVSDGITPQTLVLDSDYSVTLNLDQVTSPGGWITYPISGSPLPVGLTLVIVSDVPYEQDVSLPTGGAFNASVVELMIDRQEVQLQQFNDSLNRTIRVPAGETLSAPLPSALTRANYLLGFDGAGNPVAVAAVAGTAASLALDLASTAVNTKGAGQIGFLYSLGYGAGTVGRWLKDLATSAGSTFIGFALGLSGAVTRTVQSFLRDLAVTPQGFGAIGNGVADDTAAFAAALATGRNVYVPYGIYKITSPLALATPYQRIFGDGWGAQLNFALGVLGNGIVTSNATGWQRIHDLFLNGVSNTSDVVSVGSPEIGLYDNYVNNSTVGGRLIAQQDENVGANIYNFGMRVRGGHLYGSFTTGSRGIRLGLNSQTASIRDVVIENVETGISAERNTDSLVIDGVTLEHLMSTGYGVDMRSVASTSVYQNVQISGCHFEDVYGGIAWGTTGGTGATYTSCDIHGNKFSGHAGGTNYFLTVGATCGAGSANNRVEYNDCQDNLTYCFNLNDANGAASIVSHKGNTVASGQWATGTQAIYAYSVRQVNGYFGNVVTAGAFASSTVTRLEMGTGTFRVPVRTEWLPGEFLDNIQVKLAASAGAPTVNVTLYKSAVDTTTSVVSTGAVSAAGVVTLNVNTVAVPGFNYFLEFVCAAGGGTSYSYPAQMYVH